MDIPSIATRVAFDRTSREWNEDEDVDMLRPKAIREFGRHTGGEPIENAMKIGGDWVVFTTELGAYRLAKKYRKNIQDVRESKNVHRGTWLIWVTG